MNNSSTNKLVKISLLSAVALILRYIEFPILPMFAWLQMDLSDVPALLGGFGFGPVVGVAIELIKNVLIVFIRGTGSGFVGELANFAIGSSLIVPAALFYKRNKSKKSAIIGMIIGGIFMEIFAIIFNLYVLLPAYGMHMNLDQQIQYVTLGLLPFNAIKALIVSVITYAIYKKVSVSLFNVTAEFGTRDQKRKVI